MHSEETYYLRENQKRKLTISESNAGLMSIDVVEHALISNLALGSQAYQAPNVGIGRWTRSGSTFRSHNLPIPIINCNTSVIIITVNRKSERDTESRVQVLG